MASSHQIDAAMCERLITGAQHSCAAQPVTATQPNWDATAASFASLSNAFAWGSILIAMIAIVGAVGWGFVVRVWAEREARKEASECVRTHMDKWLSDEAPGIVRQHVEFLRNTSLGKDDDDEAADEMGKKAG